MKSIANQYRDLKEGKMSQQNFMRNLRMTMPQYVTNTTSFGDAVRILKNKSIIVESNAGNDQWLDAFQDALGFKTYMSPSYLISQYGDMKPEDAARKFMDDSTESAMAKDKEKSARETGLEEGDEELDVMVKKMEDEKAGEEEVKSQYDLGEELNEAKKKEDKVEYNKQQANPTELRLGIRTELECDSDIELDKAKEIAYKNIAKDPIYYTKLKLSGVEAHPKKVKDEKEAPTKKKKEIIQLVDLVNGMQKVKMPKKEDKKKLKEASFNVIGEPNEVAKQVMQFVDGNATLKALSDDIQIQQTSDPNEALLRFQYWDALPGEAIEKLKLQFDVQPDSDFDEDTGNIIFYRLTPLRRDYGSKDLGASFEKMKKELEEIVYEVINEYYDGRDNLDAKNELSEAEDLEQFATKIATQHNLELIQQPFGKAQLFSIYQREKGNFGNKSGVITYEPSSKVVNVISSDEKIPQAVYAQFKADRGGNDAGFETKTFAEKDAQIAYFKNFQIAG